MGRDRAAYMREYRARVKPVPVQVYGVDELVPAPLVDRIRELEEEVRHLKRELASAHDWQAMQRNLDADIARFNSRPFTPVPKVKRRG